MSQSIQQQIIDLELSALERWNHGDPYGYLALSSKNVIYIDPFFAHQLVGIDALKDYYDSIKGKIHVERYEFISPRVQVIDNIAVLSFNLTSYCKDLVYKWHCTEIYQLIEQWQIIHTHWSLIK